MPSPNQNNYFLNSLSNLSHPQLWMMSLAASITMSELLVVTIESQLKGEVTSDFLLTGLITSFFVAGVVIAGLIYFLGNQKRVEQQLKQSEAQLRDAQHLAQMGSWELDIKNNELMWSDGIYRIFEIEPVFFGASYEAFLNAVHPEDRAMVDQAYRASIINHTAYDIEHRLLFPDGRIKYVHERCKTDYDPQGEPMRSVGTIQDITARTLTQHALRVSEARFRDTLEYAPIGMALVSIEGRFIEVNHALCEIVGYARDELEQLTFQDITYPDDLAADLANVDRLLRGEIRSYQMEKRYIRKNKKLVWVQLTASILWDDNGNPLHFIAQIEDISGRKSHQEQIHQLAYYDELTKLPNRRLLIDRLNHALAQAKRYQRSLAVMFLDLDHFKDINDSMGHDVGDALLKHVAAKLNACIRSMDTIARQGGDEFIIVLAEIAQSQDATVVAEKVIDCLKEPMLVHGDELAVTTSIGIMVYPPEGEYDARGLIKKADAAMYAAKAAGRNNYCFYSPEMTRVQRIAS